MRYLELFGKTLRQSPKEEVAPSAKLLVRAGFIAKEVSGVYNFLPLGFRVLGKIAQIIREEMERVGGQEIFLAALQNKLSWQKTGRWESFEALFKVKSRLKTEYALGPTHEEVLVPLAKHFIQSWRDLPLALYQIQTKFRDEPRAKSGILRTREFLMKDLYSFHKDENDLKEYYEKMKKAYQRVFQRLGLVARETEASGGTFSQFSHEFQVLTPLGEDTIFYCPKCHFAQNEEITNLKEDSPCPWCGEKIQKGKAIEVGNIFPLGERFSQAFNLTFKDRNGQEKLVFMGCYGIGLGRAMGAIVEVHHDEKGIIWPELVAPYQGHLIVIMKQKLSLKKQAEEVYQKLKTAGVEILYDDRQDISGGEKFADADLIGCPVRLVISEKTQDKIEWKNRSEEETEVFTLDQVVNRLRTPEV